MDFEYNEEIVEMHFTLSGSTQTQIDNLRGHFEIHENCHNIFYSNDIKGRSEWASKETQVMEIHLRPDFFANYLPDEAGFRKFRKIINERSIGFINRHNHPITPQMHMTIHDIINCPWKNSYRKLFLESKVLELLLLQLEQFQGVGLSNGNGEESKDILDKMHQVRQIILKRLNNPLTLMELVKEVNTNECTLKKEFKRLFGTTVYHFVKERRLEDAKAMLLSQNMNVREVSDQIGYKNQQHFSFAFKKKFGVSPSALHK